MKQSICVTLCLLLFCSLWGCQQEKDPPIQTPVEFFYLRTDFSYKDSEAVVSSELRESAEHEDDLMYLINLYLNGPKSSSLTQPFPKGCSVISCTPKSSTISLVVSDNFASLSGIELTSACICLAKTLTGLTKIDTVVIQTQTQLLDGQKHITIQDSEPVLTDDYIAPIQYK